MARRPLLPLILLAGATLGAQIPNPLGLPDPLGLSKPKASAPAPKGKTSRFAEPRRDEGRRERRREGRQDGDRGHRGRGKAKGHHKH